MYEGYELTKYSTQDDRQKNPTSTLKNKIFEKKIINFSVTEIKFQEVLRRSKSILILFGLRRALRELI